MTDLAADIAVLRELAKQYADLAAKPIQQERRDLWRAHNSLRPTRVPVLATYGMWNVWCREVFGDHAMLCRDPFYRGYERLFRMKIFQDAVGDDTILEPWVTLGAARHSHPNGIWGVKEGRIPAGVEGGAWRFDPPLKTWADRQLLVAPRHEVDEAATAAQLAKLGDAIGDLLPIDVDRGPALRGFWSDISTNIARIRGLEQLMIDMSESPRELHGLLAFMRDAILACHAEAERRGHWTLTGGSNQGHCYSVELPDPKPNSAPCRRKDLWGYCAAQEFTLISPAMHEEFLFQYQRPIYERFGLVAYGCCEDLTTKIAMLRRLPNLRQIAVTPVADVARCAAQIGADYTMSWRPNPSTMVCCGFHEARIRQIIGDGLRAARGCRVHIHLKDIETVEGEPGRLARWVGIVRDEAERVGQSP